MTLLGVNVRGHFWILISITTCTSTSTRHVSVSGFAEFRPFQTNTCPSKSIHSLHCFCVTFRYPKNFAENGHSQPVNFDEAVVPPQPVGGILVTETHLVTYVTGSHGMDHFFPLKKQPLFLGGWN